MTSLTNPLTNTNRPQIHTFILIRVKYVFFKLFGIILAAESYLSSPSDFLYSVGVIELAWQ